VWACCLYLDFINTEAVFRHDAFIIRRQIDLGQQPQQFIRAVAGYDIAGNQTAGFRNRQPQAVRIPVGVKLKPARRRYASVAALQGPSGVSLDESF